MIISLDIGRSVISSLKWLAIFRFLGQLINWTLTIVVIRLLAPADYGLMSQAMIVIGLFALINEMGMNSALVQCEKIERIVVRQVFGLALILNLALVLLTFWLAPYIALFFNEPELTNIIYLLSLGFIIGSLVIVPTALLTRKMDFKKKALTDFIAMLIAALVTLFLAINHYGVWSLVIGHLVSVIIKAIGLNLIVRYWIFPSFRFNRLQNLIKFGGTVTADRVLWYLYVQADMVIVGRLLGKEILGIYSVAMQLATLPMQKISGIVNEVGFAAFSRIQDEAEFQQRFLKASRVLSAFAFPVFFGISAVTSELVEVFLGEKWLSVIIPMQLISLVIPLRMIFSISSPTLAGKGRPDVGLKNLLIASFWMPAAFLVGSQWELQGLALAWMLAYPPLFVVLQLRVMRVLEIDFLRYLLEIMRPLLAAIIMYFAVLFVRLASGFIDIPQVIVLAVMVFVGALTYISFLYLFQWKLFDEFKSILLRTAV